MMVVVVSPSVNDPLSFGDAQKQFSIEQLVSKSGVERLDVAVFPWTDLGNVQRSNIRLIEPLADPLGYEFRAIVTADVSGPASHREQVTKGFDNCRCRKRTANLQCQALASEFIDHCKNLQWASILGPISQKVIGPDVILMLWPVADAPIGTTAWQPPSFCCFRGPCICSCFHNQ